MSEDKLLKKIPAIFTLKRIFSFLQLYSNYRIIKYNKTLQKKLDINFEDSILNYQVKVLPKKEINIKEYFFHEYNYPNFLKDIKGKNISFLIKYKGFKIIDYPLPSIFDKMNNKNKINFLENNEYFFKYKLNDDNIGLIDLINEVRTRNNKKKLIYNKYERINDYFQKSYSNNKNLHLINPLGRFRNIILKNNEDVIKKLLIDDLKYIMIFEKEKIEYIFIYSSKDEKENIKNSNYKIIKSTNFHIINHIVPIINKKMMSKNLKHKIFSRIEMCFNDEGYQIFSIRDDTLIGVLEGPPNTPFEEGFFLFKIIFPDDYPIVPPKFIFISKIFHPNISEEGFVSCDILQNGWSPGLNGFFCFFYSVQSLLDDPNANDFLNESAAKLWKENRNIYNETVREYTSIFANYSKFLEDIKHMNIKIIINEKRKKFRFLEE